MSPARRRKASEPDPKAIAIDELARLGLRPGAAVRFRRDPTQRWREATVDRRERDGSIRLVDAKGAARALPIEAIEVRATGPRGGTVWEPLTDVVARAEQLRLL